MCLVWNIYNCTVRDWRTGELNIKCLPVVNMNHQPPYGGCCYGSNLTLEVLVKVSK